ncbi:MAG: extracellular solute-binding protein family 1 [Paenibacillus sp.]|jgi:multiple sugar transport system substrate-binding protein|nr:extracellular solute-binding protein family 1 [Paenibacillus sp.]
MNKNALCAVPLLGAVLLVSACGAGGSASGAVESGTDSAQKPSKAAEPVALTFFLASKSSKTVEQLKAELEAPVQKKYPNISFNFINNDEGIDKFLATNTKTDIIFGSYNVLASYMPYALYGDMSDLISGSKYDLSRFEQPFLDAITGMTGGKMSALPFYDLRLALYYNKDIFDRFAVPYPKDGSSWEDIYDLAKKLTRQDGGIQYRGIAAGPSNLVAVNPFSLGFVDPKTNRAVFQTTPWKTFMDTLTPLFMLPGYGATKSLLSVTNQSNLFFNDKTAAMLVAFSNGGPLANSSGLNWDLVSLPEMKGLPGTGSQPYPVYLALSSNSPHRAEAFQAITQLVSDEVLLERSADMAMLPPVKTPAVKAAYSKNAVDWKGKNVSGVVNQKPASPMPYSPNNITGQTEMTNAMISIIVGEKDVNTALREFEEQANKKIEAAVGK